LATDATGQDISQLLGEGGLGSDGGGGGGLEGEEPPESELDLIRSSDPSPEEPPDSELDLISSSDPSLASPSRKR
jgi:hypothetical protein